MKRFQIKITLSNGDKINAKSVGENREDAVNRLFSVPEFVSFIGSNEIKTAEAVEIPFEKINPENFLLQKSESKENHFVVTDLKRNFVIIFERGFFNDRQKCTMLFNNLSELDAAAALREIGEFLWIYHRELI